MPPIELSYSCPSESKQLIANAGKEKHLRFHDINFDLKGEPEGGIAVIKRDSKKYPAELHLKAGDNETKTYSYIAKGGHEAKIEVVFIGK
jgi:hypothetical protein